MKYLSPHEVNVNGVNGTGTASSRVATFEGAPGPNPGVAGPGGGGSSWPGLHPYYPSEHPMASPVPQPPSPANRYHHIHPHPHPHTHGHPHPHHHYPSSSHPHPHHAPAPAHSHYYPYVEKPVLPSAASPPVPVPVPPGPVSPSTIPAPAPAPAPASVSAAAPPPPPPLAGSDVVYVTTPTGETLTITFPAHSIAGGEIRVLDIKREVARALHTSPDYVRLFLGCTEIGGNHNNSSTNNGNADGSAAGGSLSSRVRSVGWNNGVVGTCLVESTAAEMEEAEARIRAEANAGLVNQSHEQWKMDEERRWQEHEHWRRQQEMSWEERIKRWQTEQPQWEPPQPPSQPQLQPQPHTQTHTATQTRAQTRSHSPLPSRSQSPPKRAVSYDCSSTSGPSDTYPDLSAPRPARHRPASTDHGRYTQPQPQRHPPQQQQQQQYVRHAYPETHLRPPSPVLHRTTPNSPHSPQPPGGPAPTSVSADTTHRNSYSYNNSTNQPDVPPPKFSASISAEELLSQFETYYRGVLGPRMDRYIAGPPREAKKRDSEYGLLYHRSLNEIVCEMDRIEIAADERPDLRDRRKALLNAVLHQSELVDEAYYAAGGERRKRD